MTAGRGIIHAELPNADKTSHTLQLWLNLPAAAKMVDSAYQDLLADRALRVDEA
jgi:redox-sensitive bicupin YhaK (pirin superfamily)